MTTQAQTVPSNVRAEMARRGITQATVARALGKTQQAVSARLNGKVAFDVDELHVVAELLSLTPADLLTPVSASTARNAS